MFNIFDEIPWNHFQNMPGIKGMPLQEQVNQYNNYLNSLSVQRVNFMNWLDVQPKGDAAVAGNTGDDVWSESQALWEEAIGTWDA